MSDERKPCSPNILVRMGGGIVNTIECIELFCLQTVQWRRPAASALYLLMVNACFWACVFYVDRYHQISLLIGAAATIFLIDFMQRFWNFETMGHFKKLKDCISTPKEASVANQFLSFVTFLCYTLPVLIIIIPVAQYIWSWLYARFFQLSVIVLSLLSVYFLEENNLEKACWSAYGTVILTLIMPPWRANDTSGYLWVKLVTVFNSTMQILNNFVYLPLKYIVLFEWVSPLMVKLTNAYFGLKLFISVKVLQPLYSGLIWLVETLKYWCLGYWIPPLLTWIKLKILNLCYWIQRNIVQPIINLMTSIWNGFLYIVLGRWIPPLLQSINVNIIQPIKHSAMSTKDMIVFVVFCYWVPPLIRYLKAQPGRFAKFVKVRYMIPFKLYLIDLKKRAVHYLYYDVWLAGKKYTRVQLIKLKRFVKNKILKPMLVSFQEI